MTSTSVKAMQQKSSACTVCGNLLTFPLSSLFAGSVVMLVLMIAGLLDSLFGAAFHMLRIFSSTVHSSVIQGRLHWL